VSTKFDVFTEAIPSRDVDCLVLAVVSFFELVSDSSLFSLSFFGYSLFCSGILFPVKCKDLLPIDHLIIKSVAVRGKLGPLTVWVSNENAVAPPTPPQGAQSGNAQSEYRFRLSQKYWTKCYEQTHKPSFRTYKTLELETPIRLQPGQVRAIYIHSTLPGDEAIVYDNSYYGASTKRYDDSKLAIMTGRAHVSTRVFGQDPIWGYGNAWRDRREFVGKLDYGVVYKLWNPQVQPKFGRHFQDGARSLFLCQRRWESPCSKLPDECIFYILNMCRWDWFHDSPSDMQARRKKEKRKVQQEREQRAAAAMARRKEEEQRKAEQDAVSAAARPAAIPVAEQKPAASTTMVVSTGCGGCRGRASAAVEQEHEDDDEDDDDEDYLMDDAAPDDSMDEDEDDDDVVEELEVDEAEEVDSDAWSDQEDQYYRANHHAFTYRDVDSDDDGGAEEEEQGEMHSRSDWIRRQFARIHVLRALASMEDGAPAVAHVRVEL
jgi:hypothetical protein